MNYGLTDFYLLKTDYLYDSPNNEVNPLAPNTDNS